MHTMRIISFMFLMHRSTWQYSSSLIRLTEKCPISFKDSKEALILMLKLARMHRAGITRGWSSLFKTKSELPTQQCSSWESIGVLMNKKLSRRISYLSWSLSVNSSLFPTSSTVSYQRRCTTRCRWSATWGSTTWPSSWSSSRHAATRWTPSGGHYTMTARSRLAWLGMMSSTTASTPSVSQQSSFSRSSPLITQEVKLSSVKARVSTSSTLR